MPPRLSLDQEQSIVAAYLSPASDGSWLGSPTIAGRFGISARTVQNVLRRHGVESRDQRESHAHGKRCKPIKNLPQGVAPLCKCGCGAPTEWNRRKNRWNVYVDGHYRPQQPFRDPAWLREHYLDRGRSTDSIAAEFGVAGNSVRKWLQRYGIPLRDASEAHIGLQIGSNNPAWKGGIANWRYSPGWKRISRKKRAEAGYRCQECGAQFPKKSKLLQVHHRNEDRSDDSDENLIVLCATCHGVAHRLKPH